MDILQHNRKAWNNEVEQGNDWTIPVTKEEIEKARNGEWHIVLTPHIHVPQSWYPQEKGSVLCLASGGGQQGPILAAAGFDVTVFDNSDRQLERDEIVAKENDLSIRTIQGDMRDLSCFEDESFDFIVHPVSNLFVDDVNKVWKEAYRVLKKGGIIISGFCNPYNFIFDWDKVDQGLMEVSNKIPYADIHDLPKERLQKLIDTHDTLEFSHTLDDQIGGQIAAGFVISGFYEDTYDAWGVLAEYIKPFMATKAEKR